MQEINKTIKILEQTLINVPDDNDLRNHLATLLLSVGDTKEAISHFEQILQKESNNKQALFGVGKCSYLLKNYSDSLIFLGKLLTLTENTHSEANFYMAKSYIAVGDLVNARNYYTLAIKINPLLADDSVRKHLYGNISDSLPTMEDNVEEYKVEPVKIQANVEETAFDASTLIDKTQKLTFSDVGGMDELKETIRNRIIYPFQNPEVFEAYGKKIGGGILLYGPPGCGKTFIAKATAGECKASFISIGIDDVLDMWLGQSEKKLHEIFEYVRKNSPSILFIDEMDALGGSRQHSTTSSTKMLVNQLLSEMDGINSKDDKVLIIAATNTPWFVDTALKRPGRFDRVIFIAPPDLGARLEILQLLTSNINIKKFDFKKIASKTEGFSGADLKALVELSSEDAINYALKTGKMRELEEKDFINVLKKIKPSTKEWFFTAKNYANYSNQSGFYDDIADYITKHKIISKNNFL